MIISLQNRLKKENTLGVTKIEKKVHIKEIEKVKKDWGCK